MQHDFEVFGDLRLRAVDAELPQVLHGMPGCPRPPLFWSAVHHMADSWYSHVGELLRNDGRGTRPLYEISHLEKQTVQNAKSYEA